MDCDSARGVTFWRPADARPFLGTAFGLQPDEWEALCDGCGKCCLNKIEYEDMWALALPASPAGCWTAKTCQCSSYANRHDFVPDCVVLTPRKLKQIAWWLPATCAYRLRAEGKPLYDWHYLISGDRESIHRAGASRCGLDHQRGIRDRG